MAGKIEFEENKAIQLIQKYGLSKNTLKVWKTRGYIPAKYLDDNYLPGTEASKAEHVIANRIIEILNQNFFQANVICETAGVKPQKFFDVRRGNVSAFSAEETIALKKEIAKLRISIVKTFEKKSAVALRSLLSNPELNLLPILKVVNADKNDYDRVSRFKRRIIEIDAINYDLVKDAFISAAMHLVV